MRTNRTNIAITLAEAAELSSALFSSGSAAALELAPVFADIASGRLTAIELAVAGSQTSAAAEPIVIGDLSIDLASRAVKVSGAPVSLTPKEFDILAFLASNRSKQVINDTIWNTGKTDTDKLSIFDGEISKDNGNCSKHSHSCDGSDRFKLSGRIGEQSNEFFH